MMPSVFYCGIVEMLGTYLYFIYPIDMENVSKTAYSLSRYHCFTFSRCLMDNSGET
ncbi:hypothetical protein Xszus_01804 [Xenorhabdus szentirmaii]|uniref:Uncharacterized protein n=1 Tax=Xenorhabdus szentirmaii DSM 16338 TaxID=1427518 RepID=W1ISZ3_9GAMM|nr:hypothetical protein Xsze_02239 [Xenorhabdus szentirmaii DSM 16338]PHM42074.1 hypothetical protein Xszus_01804 [Xenorhabdus szentirmaii]CDL81554.1 hypothetical protein XSR1_140028 [Xenorhabdus szentirmaii DSM 16338]